ncbi:MAG: Pycsar system effector family protein [Aestuariibaculum sp.]
MHTELLLETENYVSELLQSRLSSKNYYHNTIHTRCVVMLAEQLAKAEHLSEAETLLVMLSAWFHDTGYAVKDEGHEAESVVFATTFLKDKNISEEQLKMIESLILATKIDVSPKNQAEKILKDADCGHVALDNYLDISENLRTEISLKTQTKIPETDWLQQNLEFLKNHRFFTTFAQKEWQPKKEINQFKVQQKIDKLNVKKEKKDTVPKMGRGVETLFRVQLKNHIELSAIADTKANILLSVNAIIISVALSSLVPRLDSPSNFFLAIPTLVLLVFSVTSVVLSVLSTRPKVSKIKVSRQMIMEKKTNILFFGNFYKMTLNDFEWGIDYLMQNEDTLYNSLTKDLYYLGLVLERKYRLLRITYTVFMIGIVLSALAFIVSYQINVNH